MSPKTRREMLRQEMDSHMETPLGKFLFELTMDHIDTFGRPPSDAALCQAIVMPMKARLICAKVARKSSNANSRRHKSLL